MPGSGGVSGSGVLLELRFQAVARGGASIRVEDISLRNARLEPIAAAPPAVAIQVP